jgi:hypothetical protein
MAMKRVDSLNVMKNKPAEEYCLGFPGASAWECSHEEKTGGQHFVMNLPQGFRSVRGYNAASLDIYVLAGQLYLGAELMTIGSYTYIPSGMDFEELYAENGARLLIFSDKKFEFFPQKQGEIDPHGDEHVPITDTWKMPWLDPMKDIVKKTTWVNPETGQEDRPPGVLTKALRKEGKTGEVVALTSLSPGYVDPGTEHHPHNECLYLISGDAYIGYTYDHRKEDIKEDLVLHKDYYIGRPPGIRHGPVCTQNGALFMVHLGSMYTGIYRDVDDWQTRVGDYLSVASFR